MILKKLVAIPMAGAIFSAAFVSAQDKETQPAEQGEKPQQTQGQNRDQNQGQRDKARQTEQSGLTGDRAGWNNPDQAMAGVVVIQNQEEVALSKLAQDKLQNEEARRFATMMIEQHQAYLTKLERFAPEAGRHQLSGTEHPSKVEIKTNKNRDGVERAKVTVTDNPQKIQQTAGTDSDRTTKSGEPADLLQIQREIAQECLNAAKSEMQGKQGIEADQCFLGFQIAKHGAMKAQLTVFQRHASPELAQVFAEGAATAEKHKNEAEKIMKSLASNDSTAAGRNQGKEPRGDRNENK